MPGKRNLRKHETTEIMGVKSDAERITEYLLQDADDVHPRMQLTARLKTKLDRVVTAQSLLLQHKFPNKVMKILKNTYGYTTMSAMSDLQLVNEIFGPLMKVTKDLRRAIAEEMIRQDREMAIEARDTKAASMATANYIKLFSLDKEDAEMPDLSLFKQHQLIIAVIPEQVGINPLPEEKLLEKLQDWIEKNTTDIEHEPV